MAEEVVEPVGALRLHLVRAQHWSGNQSWTKNHPSVSTGPLLPTNEVICLLDVQDVATLEGLVHTRDIDRVLWSEKTNQRKLGLFTMLVWCQGLGLIAVGHWASIQLCGYISECYTYVSPGVYWAMTIVLLACIARLADSKYFQGRILGVENGVAFFMLRKSAGTSVFLTAGAHGKAYQQGMPQCPITLLYCRWKRIVTEGGGASDHQSSSFIKLAVFTVPKEPALQVPVACDVIDTLRASFRSTGMSFMNYHGILVASLSQQSSEEEAQQLMTFLFRSGFSILCNDAPTRIMVAMRRMGGYGVWRLHSVERPTSFTGLSLCLHFIPSSPIRLQLSSHQAE